jgi:hypothetical protein
MDTQAQQPLTSITEDTVTKAIQKDHNALVKQVCKLKTGSNSSRLNNRATNILTIPRPFVMHI